MSYFLENVMDVATIEDCRCIDPLLRSDLEVLDDEIRSIVARMSAKAAESGGSEIIFSHATSTVLLSIAATLTGTHDTRHGEFDIGAFLARATNAANWVKKRRERYAPATLVSNDDII